MMLDNLKGRWLTKPAADGLTVAAADDSAVDHRACGDKCRDARQWTEAGEAYFRHLALHPEDASIWVQAGNCLKEAGLFDRSLEAYKQAEVLDPKNFDVHLQLGHLYKIIGRLSSALTAYEEAALLNPGFGEIKHEIQAVTERIKVPAMQENSWITLSHPTLERLLAVMKMQTGEEDIFASYFRSLGAR